ncbi:MAG: GAF domain-containing protein [Anaerolineae bacterium]
MSHITSIFENHHLPKQAREALAETEKLYEINARLNAATTLQEILEAAALPGIAMGAGSAGLFILDPDSNGQPEVIELGAVWNASERATLPLGTRFRLPDFSPVEHPLWLIDPTRPLLIDDVDADQGIDPVLRTLFLDSEAQAVVFMPLAVGERRIGLIVVNWPAPQFFTENERRLYRLSAQQAALMLDNHLLVKQTQYRTREIENLYLAGRRINEAGDLQEIVAAAAEAIPIPAINRAVLVILERDANDAIDGLTVVANWHNGQGSPPTPVGTHYSRATFESIATILSTEPIFIDDIRSSRQDDQATAAMLEQLNIRAMAALPLWVGSRQFGALLLESEQPHHFNEREMAPYIALARQMAVAVENKRLLGQMQKRAAELETVAQVSTAASTILEADELLQTVVDLTKTSFGLYHAQVYLLNPEHKTLSLKASAGEVGQQLMARRLAIPLDWEQSLVAHAARTRQALILNDVRDSPEFLPSRLLPNTRAEMAVPMIVGNRVLGVLDVQSDATNRFTAEDVRIQTILAAQIAVALENARRFEKERQTALQLREMDRLKSEFLTNMSHELRTPLNSIIGFSEVLLGGLDGDLSENALADVAAIHTSGQHLLNLINDILDLAKIEAGKMELRRNPLTVAEVMTTIRATANSLIKDKPVDLIIPDFSHLPPFNADSIRIKQIVLNLVSNAIKFTDKGYVAINVVQEKSLLIFSVEDTGSGIPRPDLDNIFERFHQVDGSTTRKAGGTGLGLTITRHLVELHGGRIWVESQEGKGSTFYFSIPLDDD